MSKPMTICFLIKKEGTKNLVCLAEKKRGFRAGKINGYGGKFEEGEDALECAIREIREESGVSPLKLQPAGVVTFFDAKDTHRCDLFVVYEWEGTPIETEEMNPMWYDTTKIPFERMGSADPFWIPLVLSDKKVNANFYYDVQGHLFRVEMRIDQSY